MTMLRYKRPSPASYGTADFTARLAAREAALGLAADAQAERQAGRQADVAPDAPEPPEQPEPTASDDGVRQDRRGPGEHDEWGNLIVSGWSDEAHVIRSQWDGRVIRVCGEMVSGKHVIWWTFDEAQMRPVCELCFPQWRHEQTKGR